MALTDWSSTAGSNTTVGGVNIAEGCPAAGINNALRAIMADVAGGINLPILATFLASSSLANARTALGVSGGSTSNNNFAALTNAANKLPYMTGADAWSTTDFPTFGRSVVACGDAATARATLGAIGVTASSIAGGTGYVTFSIGGSALTIQWGSATIAASGQTTVTYPTPFTSGSVAVLSGGTSGTGAQINYPIVLSCSTASFVANNHSSASVTGFWIAIGV